MKTKLAWIAIVVLLLIAVAGYVNSSRGEYYEFQAKRDAWRQKCDKYREVPLKQSAEARACNQELKELVALAKSKGWTR